MISLEDFYRNLKNNTMKNLYIFCGNDENLIKEAIKEIKNKVVDETFIDFNYIKIDGEKVNMDTIVTSCETLPFISEKKIIDIYRCNFLKDGKKEDKGMNVAELKKYVKNLPEYTILVMYYLFDNDREKPSSKIKGFEGLGEVIKVDKLKGMAFQNKVRDIFNEQNKKIGKTELNYFCSIIENNMDIVTNEVEKLILYTDGREITKEDIVKLMPYEKESDIFNLVSHLSERSIKRAIDVFNDLVYKGEKPTNILSMIERQFKLLLSIKILMKNGKGKGEIIERHKLNPYIAEKMISQSKGFSEKALKMNLELCLNTEKDIKSTSIDEKNAIEILMVKTMMNK